MTQIEITAEVFRIIRAYSDKTGSFVIKRIKEHLPEISKSELIVAMDYLKEKI